MRMISGIAKPCASGFENQFPSALEAYIYPRIVKANLIPNGILRKFLNIVIAPEVGRFTEEAEGVVIPITCLPLCLSRVRIGWTL